MQTIEGFDELLNDSITRKVRFGDSGDISSAYESEDTSRDIFNSFLPNVSLSPNGAKSWTAELVSVGDSEEGGWRRGLLHSWDKMREAYSWLEKEYDDLACEKIKAEEQHKREETAARLKSNIVTCLACCEATAMCVFIPCFHMVLCEKCAVKGSSFRIASHR